MAIEMYDHPAQCEPLLVADARPAYRALIGAAHEVAEASAAFAASVPPAVARSLADLVAGMNCYYSNLIEGHRTLPLDIELALRRTGDDRQARVKSLADAHVQVARWAQDQALTAETIAPCISELHRRYCQLLPDEHLVLEDGTRLVPGEIRTREVRVGRHVPPAAAALAAFLDRYAAVYGGVLAAADRGGIHKLEAIVGSVFAHHRLLWIHPFVDGNGRVARIVLDLMLRQAGLKGIGLWSMSRGFAKTDTAYKAALEAADAPRRGDLDGRGNLSEAALVEFAHYALRAALDQIVYMASLFALSELEARVRRYFQRVRTELGAESVQLYLHALRSGEFERMEAARITGRPERTARAMLARLLGDGLLVSDSPRGRVHAGFPVHALDALFPALYPTGDLIAGVGRG